jgi:hypothetical protein
MWWNWYIDTCLILLTYHGNYLEKLRKIVILVHFLYFHDDVIMTYHDHNKTQYSASRITMRRLGPRLDAAVC